MSILVTGGLGFVGSHCVVELLNNNYQVIIVDNLSNSDISVLERISIICEKQPKFYQIDLMELALLEKIFQENQIDVVIHLAGYKSVEESTNNPILYYEHNLSITLNLLKMMDMYHVKKIIYSSSATVYGPVDVAVTENMPTGQNLTNAYAKSKYMVEEFLTDLYQSDPEWSVVILRYFNPAGAHPSGLLGDNPKNKPNNLVPIMIRVAAQLDPILEIYGSDYPTSDGTCVRDYVHICDLARGHCLALKKLAKPSIHIYNMGMGFGCTVKQLVEIFQKVNDILITFKYAARRKGDLAISLASIEKIQTELNWIPFYSLEDICRHAWQFYLTQFEIY